MAGGISYPSAPLGDRGADGSVQEESPPDSWVQQNPRKARFILLIVMLLAVEGGLRGLYRIGLAPYVSYPLVRESWTDYLDPSVGLWHHPNNEARHRKGCFDVTYRSNSYGMRDVERERRSSARPRALVLGSSLAEGHGVEEEERFSNRLEQWTGIEHLNFAVTGGVSSIQEWLLYQKIRDEFDHTHVIISFVPFNDFAENRPTTYPAYFYRPYLRRKGDEFELFYTVPFEERRLKERSLPLLAANAVSNASYLVNGVRWVAQSVYAVFSRGERGEEGRPSIGYDRAGPGDLEVLFYTYARIAELAGPDRQVWIVVGPYDAGELEAMDERGYDFPLIDELKAFADTIPNLHVLDLLPHFYEAMKRNKLQPRSFELPCDAHWGELGHRVAAKAIRRAIWAGGGDEPET